MTHKLSQEELQIYGQLCQVQSAKGIAKKLKNNNSYRGTIINIFRKIDNNQKEGLLLHLQVLSETKDIEYETYYRQYFMGLIKRLQSIRNQEKIKQKISPQDEQKMLLLDIIQKLKKNEQKVQNLIEKQEQQKEAKLQLPEQSIIQNIQVFEDFVSLKSSNIQSQSEEQLQNQNKKKVKKSQLFNFQLRKKMSIIILSFSFLMIIITFIIGIYEMELFLILFFIGGCILFLLICIGFGREFEQLSKYLQKENKQN